MFSEEQKRKELELYDVLGSVGMAVRRLGYPSPNCLRNWIARRGMPPVPRKPAARLTAHEKEGARDRHRQGQTDAGARGLSGLPDDPEELKRIVFEPRFENDLMREVVEVVKKTDASTRGACRTGRRRR